MSLETLTYRQRLVIGALIIVAIIVLAIAFGLGPAEPQTNTQLYEGIAPDAGLLHLDRRALDEAYDERLRHLFNVWLSSGAPQEAANFKRGLGITRRAYALAHDQIEKREQELRP